MEQTSDTTPKPGPWRPRWWVALTTVTSFTTGISGFGFLIVTGNGDPVLVVGCLGLLGVVPPLLALERVIGGRSGP